MRFAISLAAMIVIDLTCCSSARANADAAKAQAEETKLSSATDSIELLLDQISRLKQELVPESSQNTKTIRLDTPKSTARKQISERGVSPREAELEARQQQQQQQQQQQAPDVPEPAADGVQPVNQQPKRKQQRDLCNEAPAIGTVGYRLLCDQRLRPKVALDDHDVAAATSSLVSFGGTLSSSPDVSDLQASSLQHENMSPTDLRVDDGLEDFRNVIEKLLRNGNFRSLPLAVR